MSLTKEVKFWGDDVSVLFDTDYMFEFFPTKSQNMVQKLNSITRLSIYVVTLLSIQSQSLEYIKYLIYILIAMYAIYYYKSQNQTEQNEKNLIAQPQNVEKVIETIANTNENCVRPTLDNPFMNINYVDELDNPDKNEACDITDPEIKKEVESNFMNNLFRDVNDLFGKNNSQRQFYTMPSTTIPNKQDDFARWLYSSPKTCKEDQDYCLRYEDLRQNRPVMVNPYENPTNTKRLEKEE